ncbi:MAG: cytochrome c oxidase assembly factor Coa1 family protein [Candidatus Omnitrophota bacterium]|nr:cytochrome c oxidase assembly factor Coa1 family protein [Candidatus Omnitrophota bacterium]
MLKKTWVKIILVLIVITILVYCVSYILVLRSEPYQFAKDYIKNDPKIKNELGEIKTIQLHFFNSSLEYSGPKGEAEFLLTIKGQNGQRDLYISLKRSLGKWSVEKYEFKK